MSDAVARADAWNDKVYAALEGLEHEPPEVRALVMVRGPWQRCGALAAMLQQRLADEVNAKARQQTEDFVARLRAAKG